MLHRSCTAFLSKLLCTILVASTTEKDPAFMCKSPPKAKAKLKHCQARDMQTQVHSVALCSGPTYCGHKKNKLPSGPVNVTFSYGLSCLFMSLFSPTFGNRIPPWLNEPPKRQPRIGKPSSESLLRMIMDG